MVAFGSTVLRNCALPLRAETPGWHVGICRCTSHSPSIEFKRFNLQASDQCLDMIVSMSRYLQSQNTIAIRKRRIEKINQLTNQLERLSRQFNTTESSELLRDQRAQITQIEHFVDWFSNPYRELYGNTCRTLRAALNVCERNAM